MIEIDIDTARVIGREARDDERERCLAWAIALRDGGIETIQTLISAIKEGWPKPK